ncbi:hypothetical protein ASG89_21820 [Paenibacillus sp. Soil766]|uniref:hypothetical protein n=1 Tax=Paenibacillus sp. Soil766 TaxID=1736404 RepID=UPI00070FB6A8|nr:hypothetical protein [Paenibacillus sp. Soil766]KRF04487.1 hypothetical protein ASG89_21820 [Paenibacillus sp. Soil766]
MIAKIGFVFFCIVSLSVLGVAAKETQPDQLMDQRTDKHIIPPYSPALYDSTEQFEYEFEWQNGKIIANPQ